MVIQKTESCAGTAESGETMPYAAGIVYYRLFLLVRYDISMDLGGVYT